MAGIRDIAQRAGVSISTVSNVLHNKKSASDATRETILEIAAELGYEIPSVKKKGTLTVICNISDFDALYYLDILHGISDFLNSKGYSMLICTGENFTRYSDPEVVCGCIVNDVKTKEDDIMIKIENGTFSWGAEQKGILNADDEDRPIALNLRDINENDDNTLADCIIMVYDVTKKQSFEEMKTFWENF